MKRLVCAVAVVALLGLASVALAAGGLSGTYKTTIKNDPALGGALNGTWVVKLSKSHGYSGTQNGKLIVKGRATISGNTVTFKDSSGPGKCPGTGKYRFKLSGKKLKLTVISDSNSACVGRKDVLTHGAFTKVG